MKELNLTQLNHIRPLQAEQSKYQIKSKDDSLLHIQPCTLQLETLINGNGLVGESLYVGLHFTCNFIDKIGHQDYTFLSTLKESAAFSFAVGFTLLEINIGMLDRSQYEERVNQLISSYSE